MLKKARLAISIIISKFAQLLSRMLDMGGTAFPGLVVENLYPDFLHDMLSQLPEGIVIVTGTNGKTSTTKALVIMLELAGKRVLTNRSGSNFTRGIAAAIVSETPWLRTRLNHDIGVFEIDEAYASRLTERIQPRVTVALNISRDQLDRLVEIDITTGMVANALAAATEACVLNADDPHLAALVPDLTTSVHCFGVDPTLQDEFLNEESLGFLPRGTFRKPKAQVKLKHYSDQTVTYECDGQTISGPLILRGSYNYLNGAAAIATTKILLPAANYQQLFGWLSKVQPAFGRGEILRAGSQSVELVLVKNPVSFRQNLARYGNPLPTAIALNDYFADGRDVSWIWDVDFTSLRHGKPILASGSRAVEMAVRLAYDDVAVAQIEPKLLAMLSALLALPGRNKRIYCTYTAMLSLRKALVRKPLDEKAL